MIRPLLFLLLFAGLFSGSVVLLNKRLSQEKNKLRKQIANNYSGYDRMMAQLRLLLAQNKITKGKFAVAILGCGAVGFMLGKILYTRNYLAAIFGLATSLLPFAYLFITANRQEHIRMAKLESSMLTITTGYLVEQDLTKVIRNNLNNLEYDAPFLEYLTDVLYINANVVQALTKIKQKEHSLYFTQWVDILIQAQNDHSVSAMAMVVIRQMNAVKRMQDEADAKMFADWQEFFKGVLVVCCIPLFLRILMYEWYLKLITTPIGVALVILFILSLVYSVVSALKTNQALTN